MKCKKCFKYKKRFKYKLTRVGTLKAGTRVTILGEENGWYKIKFNKSFGYVSKAFIK
ncbi:SH3 domain-containing protein [Clostridium sp. Marseille-Q2269]|uniref:SH3 domain-containing protein n=1 Tax=Clostridium sp. Marseille-Q2269 TaxID=2942205 RepID=UPI003365625E